MMKAFVGIAVLVVVMIGSGLAARTPGTPPRAATVELTETAPDEMPLYLHFDPTDWR
jgi:hypothetical protein